MNTFACQLAVISLCLLLALAISQFHRFSSWLNEEPRRAVVVRQMDQRIVDAYAVTIPTEKP